MSQSDAAHSSHSTSPFLSEHGQEVRAWADSHGAEFHLAWAPTVELTPSLAKEQAPREPWQCGRHLTMKSQKKGKELFQ